MFLTFMVILTRDSNFAPEEFHTTVIRDTTSPFFFFFLTKIYYSILPTKHILKVLRQGKCFAAPEPCKNLMKLNNKGIHFKKKLTTIKVLNSM